MAYMISLDLDETLLKTNKKINVFTKFYLRRLLKHGHYVIINTGRPYQSAERFYKSIGLKNLPIISSNGTNITYYDNEANMTHEEIFNFDANELKEFYLKARKYFVGFHIQYIRKQILLEDGYNPFWLLHPKAGIEIKYYEDLLPYMEDKPMLSNVYLKDEDIEAARKILDECKSLSYRIWKLEGGISSFEIFKKGIGKGVAMLYLADKLGIDKDNIYAFGDQFNDLDMLTKAKYGVAMVNAIKEVKEKVNYVTYKDNNHNGVVHYLYKRGVK